MLKIQVDYVKNSRQLCRKFKITMLKIQDSMLKIQDSMLKIQVNYVENSR